MKLKNTLISYVYSANEVSLPNFSYCKPKNHGGLDSSKKIMRSLTRTIRPLLAFLTLLRPKPLLAITIPSPASISKPGINTTALNLETNPTIRRPRDTWQCLKFLDHQVTFSNYHEPHFSETRAHRFVTRDLQQDFPMQRRGGFSDVYEYQYDGMTFRMVSTAAGVDLEFRLLYATLFCLREWIEEWEFDLREGGVPSMLIVTEEVNTHVLTLGHWGG